MTDYVTRDDTNLGVGRILTSPTMYALYDNPTAIADGAEGAPRIQTAAIQDGAVTHDKIANGNVIVDKLATGTGERDWVLARTAGADAGAVGTYAFLQSADGTALTPGQTKAGSNLAYAGLFTEEGDSARVFSSTAPAGTWRAMGRDPSQVSPARRGITLWLRIS